MPICGRNQIILFRCLKRYRKRFFAIHNPLTHYQEWADFAQNIARDAGDIARKYFRNPDLGFERKGDNSPVTKADQEIERFLRSKIQHTYPDHGIIGEEYAAVNQGAAVQWVIDPIDGTKPFIAGLPLFGILIGVYCDGVAVAGVLYQPISNECWVGAKGGASFLNGNMVRCQNVRHELGDAILCTSAPGLMAVAHSAAAFNRLKSQIYFTRYGMDCYACGMVAIGSVDFMVETQLKLFDFAAFIAIIESAGGMISDWNGNALTLDCLTTTNPHGQMLISANPILHQKALHLLSGS